MFKSLESFFESDVLPTPIFPSITIFLNNCNFDKTGNSLTDITEYYLSNGSVVQVTCDDWSEVFEKKGFEDSLNVNLQSKKFSEFLDIAYK